MIITTLLTVLFFTSVMEHHGTYATCTMINGTQQCAGAPPALDKIKFDKPYYEISERPVVEVTGVPQTLVHLEVDDQSGYIRLLRNFNLSSNGTAGIIIDASLYKPGIYYVTATSSISKITASFSIGLAPTGSRIMLNTERYDYFPGDTVVILGAYQPNEIYQISLLDPNGIVEQSFQTRSNDTGHFASSDIKIPATAIPGIWTLSATSGVAHVNVPIKVISSMETGPASDVDVLNIKTQPPIIKVGDAFSITATFTNNSPYATNVEIDPCGEPFPIRFDDHVKIEHVPNLTCPLFLIRNKIDPGNNMTQTSPSLPITTAKPPVSLSQTVFFRAIKAGAENSTVTFSYTTINQTDSSHSQIQKTASKSFLFMIYDNKTRFSTNSDADRSVTYAIDSPLKQFKSGISAMDVKCSVGYVLTIKSEDGSPACVRPLTVKILSDVGWSKFESTQSNHATNAKTNPFGIVGLMYYYGGGPCGVGDCPFNTFNLKMNSNYTAYLLGYNICDDNSCSVRNDLSILLPLNVIGTPNYKFIALPENPQWKHDDVFHIQVEVSSIPNNKTAIWTDLGNSTIIH